MASKHEILPFEFDSRMVEWNLKHNLITRDQLKEYLASLPDEEANAEALQIEDADMGSRQSQNGSEAQ